MGCLNDKNDSFETPISGYYKIVSMKSTTAVDMNNDGIKTKDLYMEIGGLHTTPDKQKLSFYDFESHGNYMEVRPLSYQTSNAQLISLRIPDQVIDDLTDGRFFLMTYLHSFIFYSYKLNQRSGEIELTSNSAPEYVENGVLSKFELQADGSLKLEMTKELFDFVDSKWIQADLTIIYQKVD
jgi:hypothetical protein